MLDFLDTTGDRDDTLIILVSDNGASSEGGPSGSINDNRLQNYDPAGIAELSRRIDELGGPSAHNNYPWGWTMAGNTPFKRWKREVHEGGVADPCIVSWPARLGSKGGVRRQFAHAVDILPTVLELAGIEAPTTLDYVPQTRIDGVSFAPLLEPDGHEAPGHHTIQYFEMFGSRAIYHDGWKAVTFKSIGPVYDDGLNWNAPFSEDRWELYHVAADPAEIHDLADRASRPPGRHGRTLVGRGPSQSGAPPRQPGPAHVEQPEARPASTPELTAIYFPDTSPVPESVAANVKNRSHVIDVDVTIAPDGPGRRSAGPGLGARGILFHL